MSGHIKQPRESLCLNLFFHNNHLLFTAYPENKCLQTQKTLLMDLLHPQLLLSEFHPSTILLLSQASRVSSERSSVNIFVGHLGGLELSHASRVMSGSLFKVKLPED